mmetsp:Transcript_27235/g.55599  ORF Transcript_27235/g.55599 Transcript_27235/m.55599 type:complete len:148 (+) Transcript_27235:163-606(+)|eukprot:CAMPEP_0181323260 /NCGR_PEP_ID=MMETSP1101-20121128/19681_1 /TAXON_ID=46948 /ORGANISM="Rhodomonas abbreviata, Strain Caron Lab Isolate" /LENGTH=147 /DNA_ID=CAMNT_0023431257 /DNA_START=159 /DNA_END=602 /DNA_ORIENTATION=-
MSWFDCCDCRTGKKGGVPGGPIDGAMGPNPYVSLSGGEKLCGVGITFVEDSNGALYVKSLVPGGSAAQSGQVQVGDVLFEVNENNVYCTNPEQIGNLLLGVEGSQVELSFKRSSTGSLHRVMLYRTSVAASPAAQAQGSTLSNSPFN